MSARRRFSSRFLIDYDFYNEVIKNSKDRLLLKLMYINARSIDHERNHNLMCKKSFEKILTEKVDLEKRAQLESILKASFRPLDEPKGIFEIPDEIERNIKFAIDLATKVPYKTIILTTDKKLNTYTQNPHYKDVKSIAILSGELAIQLITEMYDETILT